MTYKMCDRDFDLDLVEPTYADDFVHHANGGTTDKAGYLARGRDYREQFESIDRPEFDELLEADDRSSLRIRSTRTAETGPASAWR